MGAEDVERQRLNVFRMELLGAKVRSVTSGSSTLKDAVNEAIKDWVEHIDTHFTSSDQRWDHIRTRSWLGVPKNHRRGSSGTNTSKRRAPPRLCSCLRRWRQQCHWHILSICARYSSSAHRCGGSRQGLGHNLHAATFNRGTVGIIHGMKTYLLQSPDGEITEPYSVAAGLDYPGVGPEHSY